MGLKAILTPRASEDLREIVEFIAADNPARAATFGEELIAVALRAGEFPLSHRIVPEIGDAAVREIVYQAYRIIYEIYPEHSIIYILRFWHAARGEPDIPLQK